MSFPKYTDKYGAFDHESRPMDRRGEKCINCGRTWDHHSGWTCNFDYSKPISHTCWACNFDYSKPISHTCWSDTESNSRYLTSSMQVNSSPYPTPNVGVGPVNLLVEEAAKKPDWRFFQNSTPGECPCGSTLGVCPDHR